MISRMNDIHDGENSIALEPLTAARIRELWSKTYNREGKPDWSHLFPYYHEDIVFEDIIQRLEGKAEFMAMCSRLAQRCEQLNMDILSIVVDAHEVFFQWTMVMRFKRFPSNAVHGCTKLTIGEDNRIIYQRDYFDLWGTIMNGIPPFRALYWKFMRRYFG
jgi:limonene-1,2-epoxide hydrolase